MKEFKIKLVAGIALFIFVSAMLYFSGDAVAEAKPFSYACPAGMSSDRNLKISIAKDFASIKPICHEKPFDRFLNAYELQLMYYEGWKLDRVITSPAAPVHDIIYYFIRRTK